MMQTFAMLFLPSYRRRGAGGGGCEYPGPFVVTNCGTLVAREEMGGGGVELKKCTVM